MGVVGVDASVVVVDASVVVGVDASVVVGVDASVVVGVVASVVVGVDGLVVDERVVIFKLPAPGVGNAGQTTS